MLFFLLRILFFVQISAFALSFWNQPELSPERKREIICTEFAKKYHYPDFQMHPYAEKILAIAKEIIVFSDSRDQDKIILSHGEDLAFLTDPKHYIHKHVLTATFRHNNDIRLTYDSIQDDFLFHTKESVKEKRILAENDATILFELDSFALRQKKIGEPPVDLHPSFQRPSDGCFYVEIATGSLWNKPTSAGNHNWIRLINDKGEVISVGVHPYVLLEFNNAYAKSPVRFYNCDEYEWRVNRTFYSHRFPLSRKEYFALKEDIIRDMRLAVDPNTTFDYSVFQFNCVDWIIEKVSKYLHIDRKDVQIDSLCTLMPSTVQFYRNKMPEVGKMVLSPIFEKLAKVVQIPRLVWVYYGGGLSTNPESNHSTPFMQNTWEFFSNEKAYYIVHPYLLEEYLQQHEEEILQLRYQELQKEA